MANMEKHVDLRLEYLFHNAIWLDPNNFLLTLYLCVILVPNVSIKILHDQIVTELQPGCCAVVLVTGTRFTDIK